MKSTPEHAGPPPANGGESVNSALEPLLEIEPIPVRVVFERSEPDQTWNQSSWRLLSVEPGEPGDRLEIRLYRDEAQGYYLNVTTEEPSIFVAWRDEEGGANPIEVTLSYDEAGRLMDAGELVDRVPMPDEMLAWLTDYVRLHYRPETGKKRRGAKPSFMRRDEFEKMVRTEVARGGVLPSSEPERPEQP